ncbi:MAG TPA: hypothetical protein PKD79_00240 [Candidatus Doudnabacteria bacterium]|nr:hypothetical protein [Candidatus Doudnabacteria bacterium]
MKKILCAVLAISLLGVSCAFGQDARVGIVKTANGGVDWQFANQIAGTEKTLLQRSISQMRFNVAGDKIFASSFDSGLYSSDDAGESWVEELSAVALYDFAIHPYDSQVMYAAAYLSERGRLFATRDGARSWTEVYSDAGERNPVRAVAINPANPNEVVIGTGKGSVILSTDAGSTWRLLENYTDRINRIVWDTSALYVVAQRNGIYKSVFGGPLQRLTQDLRAPADAQDFFGMVGLVNDYRQIAINPFNSDNLIITTNQGLFISNNGGNSWDYATMPFRQQDAAPFAVSFAPSSGNVIYVSSGSVIFKSTDSGTTWTVSDTGTNGLVTSILISRDLPQLAFAGVSR